MQINKEVSYLSREEAVKAMEIIKRSAEGRKSDRKRQTAARKSKTGKSKY